MQEEFHGNGGEGGTWIYKFLYGWNTLNTNIWLPSLSELVGYDPDTYADYNGCYHSAMQGINASAIWWTDARGGNQFAYFKQLNTSGGGEKIWDTCKQEMSWLRSSAMDKTTAAWRITNATAFNTMLATDSYAVHPAGCGTRPFYSSHRKTAPAFAGAVFLSTRFV